jgi:DNA-binding transcriptional LysR family regulator
MELMQMEMFVAVVDERSVRGAAERVFRTQPAVSIALRKLEEEVGAALFDRERRYEYRLTEVGQELYRYAVRVLNLRNEAVSRLSDLRSLRAGRLRVGANESFSSQLLPKLAAAFLKEHPGICMEVKCERSESVLGDLRDRNLDLAFVSFKPEDKTLESEFLFRDELVLIAHPQHEFAARGRVKIRDLGNEPLLVMDVSRSSPWHKKICEALAGARPPLNLTMENAPIETIKGIVALGTGIGFVPRMCVREECARRDLVLILVEDFCLERSVWLVRRRGMQPHAAKAFSRIAVSLGQCLGEEISSGAAGLRTVRMVKPPA